MIKKILLPLISIAVLFAMADISSAQGDINFKLGDYYAPDDASSKTKSQNLEDAVEPIMDMFGFLAGGGLYNSGDVHGFMGFDVGIKLNAMRVTDDQKPPFPELEYELRGGPLQGESVVPLPMIHAGVGLFGNVEVMGRFLTFPMGQGDTEGNVTLIGLGAKYGILQNFALPKVAVVAAYHYLIMPEDFDFGNVNNLSAALVVSKGLPFISFYAGAGVDYTNLTVEIPPPIDINESFNKANFKGNVGVKITPFPLLFINIDYNFGVAQGVSAGAGINFR
ncbi:hypothetical protein GF337_17240 [candidate division KSB1 bacterium]|nr:hypothetical protein [candidate division KSB1 bacterium]